MIFDLAQDSSDALAVMPAEHPRRRILALLEEAIRRDNRTMRVTQDRRKELTLRSERGKQGPEPRSWSVTRRSLALYMDSAGCHNKVGM